MKLMIFYVFYSFECKLLAVEGKLLKAHKVVLSICSPFFQEMFTTVFHQHPIIVLGNDVRAKLVSNLLEFMYQGSVNVKQSELQAFMRVAETLQIKGLTTSTKELRNSSTDDKPTEAKIGLLPVNKMKTLLTALYFSCQAQFGKR